MIGHGSKKGLTVAKMAANKETILSQAERARSEGKKIFTCNEACAICDTRERYVNRNCVKCSIDRQAKRANKSAVGDVLNGDIDKFFRIAEIANSAFRLVKGV